MGKLHAWSHRRQAVLLVAGLGLLTGCVERRYTIRTEPPGATIVVNGEEVGPSPASRNYYFYGDREITMILDGHQTKTVIQPIKAPWWDNYVTEFFTENLVPWTIRDERTFNYQMMPAVSPPENVLRDRAEGLRSEARTLPPPRRGGILGWLGF